MDTLAPWQAQLTPGRRQGSRSPCALYEAVQRGRGWAMGPVNTEIQGLTLERASGGLSKRLSQVLFRVDALEQAFSSF